MFFLQAATAYAQEAQPAQQQGVSLLQSPLTMLFIIFVIFYFLIIRPQQKKQRQQQEMLRNLAKGDKVITTGGIYGTIIAINDNVLTLQLEDRVRIRIARNAVAGLSAE